jgi:TrmH family RNA methyltransferase
VSSVARLTSRQHAVVRRFRYVANHQDDELVLLDGEHLVHEALAAAVPIEILLTDGRVPALAGRARATGATVHEASTSVIEAASPVRSPTGVVALARWTTGDVVSTLASTCNAASMLAAHGGGVCLGLCNVQDPGNVGSAIRAADGLGAAGVLSLDATADPRGWKTLRGAMGSSFHLPIGRGSTEEAVAAATRQGMTVIATVAAGGSAVADSDLRGPTLILVGSEGSGLPDAVIASAHRRVTIPMRRGVESLNVAVTAAILLFDARRQRQS